ncbi:single hybrid motif-containing protein [Mycena epipterygia]|nr:single hybrid motif-containing protein [Mycena epipterygia]
MNSRSVSLSSRLMPQQGRRSLHRSSVRRAIMMPAMSPFMTEGTIRRWTKNEGEAFLAGDTLLQIESDYTTLDIEAENPGILGKILWPDGSTNVPVEQVIALVAKTPQELARLQVPGQTQAPPPPPPLTPAVQHQQHTNPHSVNRSAARLEHAKSPMMPRVHRTPSLFEMHDAGHSATVRGIVMDHAGSQQDTLAPEPCAGFPPPEENDEQLQAAVLRKTIVSTLSRRGSGSKSSDSKRCTTTQYFDGIL